MWTMVIDTPSWVIRGSQTTVGGRFRRSVIDTRPVDKTLDTTVGGTVGRFVGGTVRGLVAGPVGGLVAGMIRGVTDRSVGELVCRYSVTSRPVLAQSRPGKCRDQAHGHGGNDQSFGGLHDVSWSWSLVETPR
jgi:predicted lipid-binding transport protein (Tim44 family)